MVSRLQLADLGLQSVELLIISLLQGVLVLDSILATARWHAFKWLGNTNLNGRPVRLVFPSDAPTARAGGRLLPNWAPR